jgi:hypothetical protein
VGAIAYTFVQQTVELRVTSEKLPRPRLYVFEQSQMLGDFLEALKGDLGDPELDIELIDDDFSIGTRITHSLCWKPGRTLQIGDNEEFFEVSCREGKSDVPSAGYVPNQSIQRMAGGGMKSQEKKMKYVIVTGGVLSGIGKGITASSIGVLMKAAGLRVTSIKIDPYLNVDAGTMSP